MRAYLFNYSFELESKILWRNGVLLHPSILPPTMPNSALNKE